MHFGVHANPYSRKSALPLVSSSSYVHAATAKSSGVVPLL